MSWLIKNKEGKKLAEFFDSALIFCACCIFIGAFISIWVQFRPQIRHAIFAAQNWLFG